jgi:hypothetical protein
MNQPNLDQVNPTSPHPLGGENLDRVVELEVEIAA